MLVVSQVSEYGKTPTFRLFSKKILWTRSPLEKGSLIALEFKGDFETFDELNKTNPSDFKVTGEHPRQSYCYQGKRYRKATLDDILNSDHIFGRIIEGNFTLKQYHNFLTRFFPNYIKNVAELSSASGDYYTELTKKFEKKLQRFSMILNGLQIQNRDKYHKERKKAEEKISKTAVKLPPVELLLLASEMETASLQEGMVTLAFKKVFAEAKDPSDTLWHILDLAKENGKLRNILRYHSENPNIEILIRYIFKLPQNCKNEKIEIHNMTEKRVVFGPDLVGAKFVGPVKIGKRALYDDEKKVFLYGTKKLKFRVLQKGGSLQKYGNTLITRVDDVETDLLKIEKIDAFSCTNPAMISHLQNRKGKKISVDSSYIEKIEKDYKVGRELADIALEELFGIDPEIARTLYRTKRGR